MLNKVETSSSQQNDTPERLTRDSKNLQYSICTLVTQNDEYAEMVASFQNSGFDSDCEFLYIDNSKYNEFDAFEAYNLFLKQARGDFIVLCHQDVLLLKDDREALTARLRELETVAPDWAVASNAGGTGFGRRLARISDPHGQDQRRGPFPCRVTAVDENFIVVRGIAQLSLSRDLNGFHLYGADLCIIADVLGWTAWVIDFHLRHKSGGTVGDALHRSRAALVAKYRRAFRTRWITTPCTQFLLSGAKLPLVLVEGVWWLRNKLRNSVVDTAMVAESDPIVVDQSSIKRKNGPQA